MGNTTPGWTQAQLLHEIEVEGERVEQLALSSDGARVAIAAHGNLEIREASTGELVHRLEGHHSPEVDRQLPVTGLAFSPDGGSLVSASWNPGVAADASLKLWDLATGKLLQDLAGDQECREVAFSADGASVWAACGADVQRYALETGHVAERAESFPAELQHGPDAETAADALPMPRQGPAHALALSKDGIRLAWAGKPPTFPAALVRLWQAEASPAGGGTLPANDYQLIELPEVEATEDPVALARRHYGMREFNPVTVETVTQRMRQDGDILVTLSLDGLKDDSVRAMRYRLIFNPASKGRWQLGEVGRQQQCRRGPTEPDAWTTALCH
ncbi:hypothetical protein LY622_18455 [Halomonas sp. M5N1S17]|nr:hypothetical protein [Halomonas alkalisoli]MCE9665409.1 hypothetical protein [Halomonas alkalisoli]